MKTKPTLKKIRIIARTHVGMQRSNNEDYHGYSTDIFNNEDWHFYEESAIKTNKNPYIMVVADGMGGLEMGEEASRIAVETTKQFSFDNAKEISEATQSELDSLFKKLFADINDEILKFAKENGKTEGELGTTLVIVLVINNEAQIYWIGDSRAYMFRKGKLQLLTKDHSYVQELVDSGKLTYEQSFFHPESNIVTKYMGDYKNTPVPSHTKQNLEDGDIVLICSDGLNGMLQDKDIEDIFYSSDDLSGICQKLIDDANTLGGNDNNTIILNSFGDFHKHRPKINPNKQLNNGKLQTETRIVNNFIKKMHKTTTNNKICCKFVQNEIK